MKGFHYAGMGGKIHEFNQVFGEIELDPGAYIVMAKATAAIVTKTDYGVSTGWPDNPEVWFQAKLEFAAIEDEYLGALQGDSDNPGDRRESLTLNLAGEIGRRTRARLRFSAGRPDLIWVHQPRISAIRVDELKVVVGEFEPQTVIDYQKHLRDIAGASGFGLGMMKKILEEHPDLANGEDAGKRKK
jgi:hypothetical protein